VLYKVLVIITIMFTILVPSLRSASTNGYALVKNNSSGNPELLKTEDLGETWIAVPDSTLPFTSSDFVTGVGMSFINASTGFAAKGATNYKTTDGGMNWIDTGSTLPSTSLYISIGLSFVDPLTGFAIVSDSVNTTTDGLNWIDTGSTIPSVPNSSNGLGVSFIDSSTGFAMVGNALFKTTDGGLNWSNFGSGLPSTSFVSAGLSFIDPVSGFAIINDSSGSASVYARTFDGGLNWIDTGTTPQFPGGGQYLMMGMSLFVPEPGTYLLMGAFLVVAMVLKKNRAKKI